MNYCQVLYIRLHLRSVRSFGVHCHHSVCSRTHRTLIHIHFPLMHVGLKNWDIIRTFEGFCYHSEWQRTHPTHVQNTFPHDARRPEELELLICGSRSLDLSALQAATLYDDGYEKDSQEIQWFWQVALALPPYQQKRLLAFATGSDRVPIKGLSALNPPFVISR